MADDNVILEILREKRVLMLILLVAIAIGWVMINGGPTGGGLKFGISFSGGVQVPVLLQTPVNQVTMEEMISTIKTRASTFGLQEVVVYPVGDSRINIEVPKNNPTLVSDIKTLLSKQGVYAGIVDGKVAVNGDDIAQSSIGRQLFAQAGQDWMVTFALRPEGQDVFAATAKGKTDYPLYMFLDRPSDSIVVIPSADLLAHANGSSQGAFPIPATEDDALAMAQKALKLDHDDIKVYLQEDLVRNAEFNITPADNKTRAIVSQNAPETLKERLKAAHFTLVEKNDTDLSPSYNGNGKKPADNADKWDAVGLQQAPHLQRGVTEGVASRGYSITGNVPGLDANSRQAAADLESRETMAILKGGALPVQISIGQQQDIPAPLGAEFLRLSVIGAIFAMLCISAMVAIRYRTPKVVLPIILISLSEVIIIVAIIGTFTIDLAAMAGIIAVIGISVDAQIVVTDEILKHGPGHEDAHQKLENAFSIIVTNAIVATVAMIPLLFSGLVDIINFATSTLLGYLLGVLITRPAYGVIVQKLFSHGKRDP